MRRTLGLEGARQSPGPVFRNAPRARPTDRGLSSPCGSVGAPRLGRAGVSTRFSSTRAGYPFCGTESGDAAGRSRLRRRLRGVPAARVHPRSQRRLPRSSLEPQAHRCEAAEAHRPLLPEVRTRSTRHMCLEDSNAGRGTAARASEAGLPRLPLRSLPVHRCLHRQPESAGLWTVSRHRAGRPMANTYLDASGRSNRSRVRQRSGMTPDKAMHSEVSE
jgi:hypothetical protein